MRALVLILVAGILAGCTGAPAKDGGVAPSTETFTATADSGIPVAEALTDTLYFLGAPHVTAQVPTGTDAQRVPIQSTAVPVSVDGGEIQNWTMPRPATLDYLTGTALLFVDVKGTVTNPSPADPCFWRIILYAPSSGGAGGVGVGSDHSVCLSEPAVLSPGVHKLTVSFPGQPVPDGAGDRLVFVITSRAVAAPGATVEVLAGSAEYASRVTLNGLQLPLTTQTLLV